MPLFKKHHDTPVDTNYAGNTSDPNYAVASQYNPDSNIHTGGIAPATHSSGVGTNLSHGNTMSDSYNHPPSHQHTTYNQPTAGYNTHSSGGMPASNAPVHNDAGRGALASEPVYPMGGHTSTGMGPGTTGTTTGTGGLTGRDHQTPYTGSQNVHNTASTGTAGANVANMSTKDAKSLEMKGKAQQLAGMLLSSESMKAKGNAKEQEAVAIRHHQTNVAEAEAHEAQARLARERAGQNAYH
ncbi:hypothetical protein BN14_05930 [Rhizoctonia solani AG-1 IB]|uniref:CsbD domain-containing protein n=2 Tax=Thanatephorus cucumeris (strain AG1-IB / isolate 7/3/14) TaxID=1108050 RepID=M5BX78_THACB|nr:hypothetical protein BN14_05930 [Rhizoctonia solani AG-1 IB]